MSIAASQPPRELDLPPELWLKVFAFLPAHHRPDDPRLRYSQRSTPLMRIALVNRKLRQLSQRLLFERVRVRGMKQMAWWAGAEASRWTGELEVRLARGDLGDGGRGLEGALRAGLGRRGEGDGDKGGRWLRVVVIDVPYGERLSEDFGRVDELRGLESLSLNRPIPRALANTLHSNLRHLHLPEKTAALVRPASPSFSFPALTHLSLFELPPNPPVFATAFPSLSHLSIRFLPSPLHPTHADLARALPPSLTHFATHSPLDDATCALLPDRLESLRIRVQTGQDLASVRRRWSVPLDAYPDREEGGFVLGVLVLEATGREVERGGLPFQDVVEGNRWRAAHELDGLKKAACRVEVRPMTEHAWRGA